MGVSPTILHNNPSGLGPNDLEPLYAVQERIISTSSSQLTKSIIISSNRQNTQTTKISASHDTKACMYRHTQTPNTISRNRHHQPSHTLTAYYSTISTSTYSRISSPSMHKITVSSKTTKCFYKARILWGTASELMSVLYRFAGRDGYGWRDERDESLGYWKSEVGDGSGRWRALWGEGG